MCEEPGARMACDETKRPLSWPAYMRHVRRVSQHAVCLLIFEVIIPALIYRYFTEFMQPVDFAAWLYLAALVNVCLPGFKSFFRSSRCLENPFRDFFQSVVIWTIYRFVWFPLQRVADYLIAYYELPCYSDSRWLPVGNLLSACILFVMSLYCASLVGDTKDRSKQKRSPIYYLPISRKSMQQLMCGLQNSLPKQAPKPKPAKKPCITTKPMTTRKRAGR